MKVIKSILIAGAALAIAAPAFAGRDGTDLIAQERAMQKLKTQKGLAGPVGPAGQAGPAKKAAVGHPTERPIR